MTSPTPDVTAWFQLGRAIGKLEATTGPPEWAPAERELIAEAIATLKSTPEGSTQAPAPAVAAPQPPGRWAHLMSHRAAAACYLGAMLGLYTLTAWLLLNR
jgi:hypothetical protein